MNSWTTKRLGDFFTFQRGHDLLAKDRNEGNIPVISSSGVTGYHDRFKAKAPGVIIGRKGTLGTVHYSPIDYWPHDTTLWITNFKENSPKFIYYFLQLLHLEKYDTGSSNPTLNRNHVHEIIITLPILAEQDKIAAVLSALDAKIELNNRINAELESLAKTIYDYWFVQFDFPDDRGKPYKSSGGKMVYDEGIDRAIPAGWEVQTLSNIANITMGQSPSGSSYNEEQRGEIFFQGSTDFEWRFPTVRQYTTEPSRMAKKGDILLSVRAPVGTLNIADNDCCIGRGLAALRSKYGFDTYLFYVMEYFKSVFDRRNSSGTTFGSINKDDLSTLKLIYPTKEYLTKYDLIVSKYNEMILNNHKQNQQLIQLRDWLLPMLMNGQVSVK